MKSLHTLHAVFLLSTALVMAGFLWAMYYAMWAANLLHTLMDYLIA